MADKVKAVVSHNQEIDGKEHKAGDRVDLDPRLAKVLASRGAVQVEKPSSKAAVKSAPAASKKEASK